MRTLGPASAHSQKRTYVCMEFNVSFRIIFFPFFDCSGTSLNAVASLFTTHKGSGLANCVEDVKKAFPGANVQKGFSIYGHEVRTEKKKVETWLNGLGY